MQTGTGLIRSRHLIVGLAAVLLAFVAQWLLGHGQSLQGGLLYALAAALAIFALRKHPGPLAPVGMARRKRLGRWCLLVGLALLAAGAMMVLAALSLFPPSVAGLTPWLWLLIGALVFLAGAFALDVGQGKVPEEERWSWKQAVVLVTIILVAAVVRAWDLEGLPFGTWYDEAENGLVGLNILHEPAYKPVYEARVNSAGHYLLLVAAALRVLGVSTLSIRLVSALIGTASIAAGYLVGREMFGRRWGFVLAFLLAVSRWSINFSRIGMYNVSTPLFELLALGFLLRGLRRSRYLDFALSGLFAGLGIVFYTGFFPFPLILVAFLAYTAITERATVRGNWRGLVVLALGALLIVSPVAQYAWQHEETFLQRTRKASVFRGKSSEQALVAMGQSSIKYLLMFNYRGDRYGRHNLSGEPMLDPLSGALMVLGLALCLWRWRRPRSLLLPLWLLAMIVPGILSLEWEAPQALRTIGALVPATLLSVVPLHDLGVGWAQTLGRRHSAPSFVLLGLLLVSVGCSNLHTYFFVQATDYESWRDFSTAETITARLMAELGNSVDYYVISYFYDHPVVRFLAPEVTEYHRIETHEDLPLPQASDREVVMVLDGQSRRLLEEARLYYPRAAFEEYTSPSGGPPVAYIIRLSREYLAGIRGLDGYYRRGSDWTAEPTLVRRDEQLSFQWSDGFPLDLPFLAEWEGVLRVPEYGVYELVLRSPGHVELDLEGARVMEGEGGASAQVLLAKGNHALHIWAAGGLRRLEFRWRPSGGEEELVPSWALYAQPVTGHGLLASYYPNGDWEPPVALAEIDSQVGFYYHIPPLPMPYTVDWEGSILVPESGLYVLAVQSIDESALYLDGSEVVSTESRDEYEQAALELEAGYHDLRLRYAARTDHMYVNLYWTRPGGTREIIPSEMLSPVGRGWQTVAAGKSEG